MSEDEQVTAVVEAWHRAYKASDAARLKALWAQAHPRLTYQATELETPLTSFAEISDYYDRVCGPMQTKSWRLWGLVVDVLSSGTAFVFALTDMLFQVKGIDAHDHYWPGRVSFVMTKTGGEWKIVHYEDSTMMRYFVQVVQRAQRASLERCVSLIEAGQSEQCVPLLGQLLEPIPRGRPLLDAVPDADQRRASKEGT